MNKKAFLIIAAVLMTLVGLLRGVGGAILLFQGNKVAVEPPIMSSDMVARLCGVGLLLVMTLLLVASYKLLKHKSRSGWNLSWIGIAVFLIGGIINGYLMFGNPFVEDQIINFSASLLVAASLLLGKKTVKR